MKIGLIDNIKRAHKLASIRIAAIAAAVFAVGPDLVQAWSFMPDSMRNALPEGTARWVSSGAFVLVILGRIFKLAPKEAEGDENANG